MIEDRKITSYEKSVSALSDTPSADGISATTLKGIFDSRTDNEVKTAINGLITDLSSTTDSASGADNIGATPLATSGAETVQGILEELSSGKVDKVSGKGLSTNDYDDTEKATVATNKSLRHSHTNKSLLDTYEQTEADLEDAVSKKHTHSNKSVLDTYNQTNENITDAVSKRHTHSNKALLDTYAQTESNIADAVEKKHSHSNKSAIDTIPSGGVVTTLGSDDTTVPTSKAVQSAISGISAAGAVKYSVAQSLTDSEKNQARANQGLYYSASETGDIVTTEGETVESSSGATKHWTVSDTFVNACALLVGGTSYTVTYAYNGTSYSFTSTCSASGDVKSLYISDSSSPILYATFDGTDDFLVSMRANYDSDLVTLWKASGTTTIYHNKINSNFIDGIFGDMQKSVYDTNNNGIVDKATADASGNVITTTYATKTEIADKVDKVSGKGLSTNDYDNTEKNKVTDAYEDKHTHSNKSLLDTYEQTESNLSDAVSKKHEHSNKSLLDTYAQTESNLSDAVSKKHSHSNKSAIDTVPSGGVVTTLGSDDTTIPTSKAVADAIGQMGGGDMLKSVYDTNDDGIVDKAKADASGNVIASTYATITTVNGKESSSNKVTSVSSTSTDTEYPSAKCLYTALADKVDKVSGKGLSTNDYDATAKSKVDNLPSNTTSELATKVDKVTGKGLSTNDYDATDKSKVDNLPSDTTTELGNKVDKVTGKGLSTNDFDATAKSKVDNLPSDTTTELAGKVPTSREINGNALTDDITLTQDNIGDGTTYKQYSATEKTKLSGIATGATANTILSTTCSLSASSWTSASGYVYKNVTGITGLLSTDTPILDIVTTTSAYEAQQEAWALIFKATVTAAGTIRFYASETPSTALTVQIRVVR